MGYPLMVFSYLGLCILQFVDLVADIQHMVKAVEHGLVVNSHPREQCLNLPIFPPNITRVYHSLTCRKTERLVMSNAVTQSVDFVQLVEDIGLIDV